MLADDDDDEDDDDDDDEYQDAEGEDDDAEGEEDDSGIEVGDGECTRLARRRGLDRLTRDRCVDDDAKSILSNLS